MSMKMKMMDGNEAAAYVSYAFTEVAAIYPITPSSPMAEHVDTWSSKGKKNIFGQPVKLVEMQSEAGAIGAMHGALETGALATSYTASQGLMLMIPTMNRISGQLKPGVLHVSARTIGTHAFSIFGDHSDVMSCRQTGFTMFSSGSVQEVMDMSAVAHLTAIDSSIPVLSFFDGFRTSHEIQKIEVLEYETLATLVNKDALNKFRKNSLNPERPVLRSAVINPDTFFQSREASNTAYDDVLASVENYMSKISTITGRSYKPFNYYGCEDAEYVIVAMGSASGAIRETVESLNKEGKKVGFVQVMLYRPFSLERLRESLPKTTKVITVLDRTKEPGAIGEPLYLDVCAAFIDLDKKPAILSGRYGLSSKDVTNAQIVAVYDNMISEDSKAKFTVGIVDDVTHLSLEVKENIDFSNEDTISCKFWGYGSDGTVGANKNAVKIIGDGSDLFAQAYFEYDTKKSGGVTKSHLRFSKDPIRSTYYVKNADFVACHKPSYIFDYDMISDLKENGTFLLNCEWDEKSIEDNLPNDVKKALYDKKANFYVIDATALAKDIGLGTRINTILQAAFFKLVPLMPVETVIDNLKAAIEKSYGNKGEKIVSMNKASLDLGLNNVKKITVPDSWGEITIIEVKSEDALPEFVKNVLKPVNAQKGDTLPVSAFKDMADGTFPMGTSKYEKRGIAVDVPAWQTENCIQCNQCSYVCPHAAVRPFLLTEEENNAAPEGFKTIKANGKPMGELYYSLQVDPLDCTGCGTCAAVCPAKNKALVMEPLNQHRDDMKFWDYALTLSKKENPLDKFSVKGSQFELPLLEFSGACAGCGETPYMKLLTQLYGDRMFIANATGCTQAWGAASPCVPYTTNEKGFGPAWSNSLFENNAEFSLGMNLAVSQQRMRLRDTLIAISENSNVLSLNQAIEEWLQTYDQKDVPRTVIDKLIAELKGYDAPESLKDSVEDVINSEEHLSKKSIWMYGGDGWAYDIGFGGLDHVFASGEDVNVLVVDTEVYSNTGGQSSKATPIGAIAQFAASGKKNKKKDLGMLAMAYEDVYVAQVAMGANPNQLIKAIKEAEAYPGVSIIVAYAPCINHGIVKGMGYTQQESKNAVDSGYWKLYRYNPLLKAEGKNPLILDSKEPSIPLRDFLMGEVRYASLFRNDPEEAERLFVEAEAAAKADYFKYKQLATPIVEMEQALVYGKNLEEAEKRFVEAETALKVGMVNSKRTTDL